MSELKNDDFLLVNREGVDYKITLESLAEYLQVEPVPEPEPIPIYSTTLTTKSKCEGNCKAGEYARGTLAGWTTEITTASTEPPTFYFRIMKNTVGGRNIGMDDFVPASSWIEYDGTVQDMGEVSLIGDDWVAFYIEDAAKCGDEEQQLRSGNYEYVCWPAILTPGEVTETEIGKFTEDNVKLSQWDNNHPTDKTGWTRWSWSVNGGRMSDEEPITNGEAPYNMISFLNGMEINRTVIKAGDVVTAETVYEYHSHQGCYDKPPFGGGYSDSSCTVTVTAAVGMPWDGFNGGIFHVKNATGYVPIKANGGIKAWNVDGTNERYVTHMAPGEEFVFCPPDTANLFGPSDANWEFGDLTDTSKVTTMESLFQGCEGFNSDISWWDTSKVTNMESMFRSCQAFNLPLNGWDTSKVTNMRGMFANAQKFNSDISKWNTWKVENMELMFADTRAFNVDIGEWNTCQCYKMDGMFVFNDSFIQDLSLWCVGMFGGEPTEFCSGSPFEQHKNYHPKWGTCPRGEDQ